MDSREALIALLLRARWPLDQDLRQALGALPMDSLLAVVRALPAGELVLAVRSLPDKALAALLQDENKRIYEAAFNELMLRLLAAMRRHDQSAIRRICALRGEFLVEIASILSTEQLRLLVDVLSADKIDALMRTLSDDRLAEMSHSLVTTLSTCSNS